MLGETCFSAAALVLLGVVVTPLLAGFGVLYRDLRASNARLAEATGRMRSGTVVMDEAETELRARPSERLR